MFRTIALSALVLGGLLNSSATAQDSFHNTYHVEVLVNYVGYLSPTVETGGSSTWESHYSTKSIEDAQLVHEFFWLALEEGVLEAMLGINLDNYVITEVRLRTELPASRFILAGPEQRPILSRYTRLYYPAPNRPMSK